MDFLKRFFLLSDDSMTLGNIPNWRVSALRIILMSGVFLCLAITVHTFDDSIEYHLTHIIIISFVFLIGMILLLFTSSRFYNFTAHTFLLLIVAGCVFVNLYVTNLELAQVGSMFMYSSPVIALMLLGFRVSLFYSLLNLVPFYMIINDIDVSNIMSPNEQLPYSDLYITGLLFVVFNICIPLATARTIVAAKRLNESMSKSNSYLKDKNELYRTFFAESNVTKIIVDNDNKITDFNRHAAAAFSLTDKVKTSGLNLSRLFPDLENAPCRKTNTLLKVKNSYFHVSCENVTDSNYKVYEFINCTQEQTIKQNLVNMEQENKRLRYCDSYTQLPNRDWFELQCERAISRKHKNFYVVVTHTANNEYLNLKFNKEGAKFLLKSAYKRLKNQTEGPLLCAHIGPGKLAFIINASSAEELKDKRLTEIKQILDEDYNLLGSKCYQSFLFGFARYGENNENIVKVISNATSALGLAEINTPYCGYNEKISNEFLEKHEISMLLEEALQNSELEVYYQPKVTSTGKCIGLEALARWNSPILGKVSPDVFISIAEEYKMISQLTDLVIQKVCAQIAYWTQAGITDLPVAINISLIDFSQNDFMIKLTKHLEHFKVEPHQIELELTETSLDANKSRSLKLIKTLQARGFTISVDDFGVGYSNIARLAEYPINKLKLDRSLISQVTTSPRQKSLVKAIHVMCDELNIKCVSEGVETIEQVTIMANMGCKEFQGYYFSKPMPVDALSTHIKQFGLQFGETINV
jgi:EAL domain-containing protein (putative c-di-GMP-specific phosphodiesterase class I)/GGDEF domain-containing protein